MYLKKSLLIALTGVFCLAAVTGCSTSAGEASDVKKIVPASESSFDIGGGAEVSIVETKQELSDGRTVTCLVRVGTQAGGLSCDWGNTSK